MLLSIQFPIADARRFLDQADRLGTPGWPLPSPDSEFVRFFGHIRNRPRGGLAGWLGEDPICSADRALSLSGNPSLLAGHPPAHVVFRRFYFDGWAVGKFEIGFHNRLRSVPARLRDLESRFLRMPVRIRNRAGAPFESELAQAGRHLARLYLMASTPTRRAISEKDEWQVRAGTPLLYLELSDPESITVPGAAKPVELPGQPSGIELFHYGIPYRGGKINMWILKHGISVRQENIARALRLYLLRLNAEHECLRLILQSIANKDIRVTRGTAASNELQRYLNKAIQRVRHYEARTDNVNEEIAEMARQSINTIRPGQLDVLLESVDDYKAYLREHIESYARQDAAIINYGYMEVNKVENRQGNTYNFSNFQAGILNIESTLTNVSQNVGSISGMDQPAKDELRQLIEQLNAALQKAPAEKIDNAQALAETTKTLVEDVSREKPNKAKIQITLAGLKQAAENIARVLPDVLPIAVQIASVISRSFALP